jgi:hypothetical protein
MSCEQRAVVCPNPPSHATKVGRLTYLSLIAHHDEIPSVHKSSRRANPNQALLSDTMPLNRESTVAADIKPGCEEM